MLRYCINDKPLYAHEPVGFQESERVVNFLIEFHQSLLRSNAITTEGTSEYYGSSKKAALF